MSEIIETPKKSLKQEVEDLKSMFTDSKKVEELVEKSKQYQKFMKKQKNFKIPNKYIKQVKNKFKQNKVLIAHLRTDRNFDITVGQKINEMIYINGTPHNASMDFCWFHKGVPLYVIPEWSLNPIGTKEYYDAIKAGAVTPPGTIILRAIEAKENDMIEKPKMSFKTLIWILLGAAVIFGYFFMNKK